MRLHAQKKKAWQHEAMFFKDEPRLHFFSPVDDSFSPFRDQQAAWVVKFTGTSSFLELPLCSQWDRLVPGPGCRSFALQWSPPHSPF